MYSIYIHTNTSNFVGAKDNKMHKDLSNYGYINLIKQFKIREKEVAEMKMRERETKIKNNKYNFLFFFHIVASK